MRVLLASGIFFPDVGGPATHVRRIAEHFSSLGWQATVVAFGDYDGPPEPYRVLRTTRRLPKVFRWALHAVRIARETRRHDVVYAFSLTSTGIPAAICAKLLHRPFLLRVGGDPIWERIVESGKRFLPLDEYYAHGLHQTDRPFLFRIIRFVVRAADEVVVYTDIFTRLYTDYYGADLARIRLLPNPLSKREASIPERGSFTFLFGGRFVRYKNLERLIRVFGHLHEAHPEARLLLVGAGPDETHLRRHAQDVGEAVRILPTVTQTQLLELIRASSAVVAPALTEFNPNFVLEAISLGKPAIVSRHNGLSVGLPPYLQFDPMRDESMEAAMKGLLDPALYEKAQRMVAHLPVELNWENVLAAHASIVSAYLPR